jgi:error-prone DNA polymerase
MRAPRKPLSPPGAPQGSKEGGRAGGKGYAILAAHSDYSLMRGVDPVESICTAAAARGAGAIALTDVNALYTAVRFWEVARECGLAPIVGADLWVEAGMGAADPERGSGAADPSGRKGSGTGDPGGGKGGGAGDPAVRKAAAPWAERAILLAAGAKGYRRLCRIVSEYHLCRGVPGEAKARGAGGRGADPAGAWPGGGRRVGAITLPAAFSLREALLEDREGLWVLVPAGGEGEERGIDLASALRRETGGERLALLIPPGGSRRRAVEWARRSATRVVASPDAFFVDAESHGQHRLLRAIDRNTKGSRLPARECVPESSWLMDEATLRARLPDLDGAVEAAARVAADCAMSDPPWGEIVFPPYRPEGISGNGDGGGGGARTLSRDEAWELLKKRSYEGSIRRYGSITRPVQERLDRELEIVRAKGFAGYFLVVADIVTRSPRTCGRGSAAASLISYALGITHVDPVRYDLYFERFLNMGRVDPPDIDVDFAWDERDEVLAHVLSLYGEDRAAMVCNHLCFRGRASVREVAKVYGLPEDEIGRVTKRLSRFWAAGSAEEMIRVHPLFKDVRLQRPWPEILRWAGRLEGRPRHLSVHCGGVVIVPGAIWDHVPVQPSAKGVNVIHWEKDQTEDAGLVKIDLLGNRSLAVIRDTLAAVEEHHGVAIPYERFNPIEDTRTRELVRRGDTVGVFYVESPAMRQLQEKTMTGDFERLVVHSSIIRPAANTYIREYVRRLRGGAYRAIHPILDDLMAETFGIMVYQEDVAKVAIALAGFDAASADDLRKVLSKKHKEKRLADYRERFFRGSEARGFDRDTAGAVWEMILSFGGYSFCKPHSASYALVSFKSAYLRAHYPAEFMAAVISNQGGYYSTFAYISECRRMGLEILPPDVNAASIPYTGCNGAVRTGLMQVQKMKEASREAVVEGRRSGPYRSLEEFLGRAGIDPADARLLILAGALDSISGGRSRPEMMWRWAIWNGGHLPGGGVVRPVEMRARAGGSRRGRGHAVGGGWEALPAAPGGALPAPPPRIGAVAYGGGSGHRFPGSARIPTGRGATPSLFMDEVAEAAPLVPGGVGDYDPRKVLSDEIATLGFLISRHPLTLYREVIDRMRGVIPGRDLRAHVGRRVTMVGWLVTGKVVDTRKGEPMEFVSFEDTTALYETTFFPEAYRKFCHMLSYTRPYVLRGKVEEDFGAVSLTVSELEFLGR